MNRMNARKKRSTFEEEIQLLTPPYEIVMSSLLFCQAFNAFSKALDKTLRPAELTVSQYVTLWALLLSSEPLTPTEISRLLPIETQSVTALLDRLQERRLIARRPSSRDRRSVQITLTEQAAELLRFITPSIRQVMVDIFSKLSIEERQLLDNLAQKIRNATTTWIGVRPDHFNATIERLSRGVERLTASHIKS